MDSRDEKKVDTDNKEERKDQKGEKKKDEVEKKDYLPDTPSKYIVRLNVGESSSYVDSEAFEPSAKRPRSCYVTAMTTESSTAAKFEASESLVSLSDKMCARCGQESLRIFKFYESNKMTCQKCARKFEGFSMKHPEDRTPDQNTFLSDCQTRGIGYSVQSVYKLHENPKDPKVKADKETEKGEEEKEDPENVVILKQSNSDKLEAFKLIRALGSGNEGVVFEAKGFDGTTLALKVTGDGDYTKEVETLLQLKLAQIVNYPHHISRDKEDLQAFTLDFFPEGCLKEGEEGKMPLMQALPLLLSLFHEIQQLHLNGYAHKDIKEANIVLTNGGKTVKLIDFGRVLSKEDDKFEHWKEMDIEMGCELALKITKESEKDRIKRAIDPIDKKGNNAIQHILDVLKQLIIELEDEAGLRF